MRRVDGFGLGLSGAATSGCQLLLVAAMTGGLTVSCQKRAEQTIKDSEGRSFVLNCARNQSCELRPLAEPEVRIGPREHRATGKKEAFRIENSGRLVGVCGPQALGTTGQPSDCRPILCEAAQDCPPAEGLNEGVCLNHLCSEPSHPLISTDAVMLCLAGTGFGPTTPLQVERLALGLNCGNPCRVPTPCRQP